MKKFLVTLLTLSSLAPLLGACGMNTELKQQTANHIARPAFMVERTIAAGNFQLQAWERMHSPHDVATIYIEGAAYKSALKSPTPQNPVGLHLASRDLSQNLGYLALPCQFIKMPEDKGCDARFWQADRFAPSVMAAYDSALNDMAARYNLKGFHLVGYDDGANVAAVLAAKRSDVLSLRTVAGNLNPDFVAQTNPALALNSDAVLAVDYASALANVPQHHFIGAADAKITPGVYHSYRQMLGLSECVHYSLVQDADHTRGWVEKWPELLTLQPQCAIIQQPTTPLAPAGDFPNSEFYKDGGARLSK